MKAPPIAKTFLDDQTVEVEVISGPNATGLCKVLFNNATNPKIFVRHVDRLSAVNAEAKQLLTWKK